MQDNASRADLELLQGFREYAQSHPAQVAVVDHSGARCVTYAELSSWADSYARYLLSLKIEKGQVIALDLGRRAEHFAATLACFYVGIVFIAIKEDMPTARRQALYDVCKPVFTFDQAVLESIPPEDEPFQIDTTLTEEDKGYIVYTSGSTGTPKTVLHNRTLLAVLKAARAEVYRPIFAKRGLDFDTMPFEHAVAADFSFILTVADFMFLLFGKTLHIIPSEMLRDGIALKTYLVTHQIQSINILPSALSRLLPLPSLQVAIVAGEPCAYDFSTCGATVLNVYGSSESTLVAFADASKGLVVGDTLGDSQAWIDGGDEGEICCSGPGIMMEYMNDAPGTSEVLEILPDGRRVLRTRDLGKRTEDGYIQVIGRVDSIVKIRGMRVSTDEVARTLEGLPEITEAAAKAVQRGKENVLYGYYATKDGAPLNAEDLKAALREQLPEYAVPSFLLHLQDFPRNERGKIVMKALPVPEVASASGDKQGPGAEASSGQILEKVLTLFRQALENPKAGPNDGFLELGGSSLMAMELQFALQEAYGVSFSGADLIKYNTPVLIAEAISAQIDNGSVAKAVGPVYTFSDLVPLTESQLNVYLDEEMNERSTRYNLPFKVSFARHSAMQVEGAVCSIIAKHPGLRARVVDTEVGPMLKFDGEPQIASLDSEEGFVRTFDLHESLARFAVVSSSAEGCELLIDIHHLIIDGTSFAVLAQEMTALLSNPEALGEKPEDDGILRMASFEQSVKGGEREAQAEQLFARMLCEADEVNSLVSEHDGSEGVVQRRIPLDENGLKSRLQHFGITKNQLLTSVFAYTLSRFTGDDKVSFCLVEDGRGQIDLRSSIGMFVRTLPLVIECAPVSVPEFLSSAGIRIQQAMAFDFYPMRKLAETYQVTSAVQFQYAHALLSQETADIKAEELPHDVVSQLAVRVDDCPQGINLVVRHGDQYSDALCERFAESFELILKGVLACENMAAITYTPESDAHAQGTFGEQNRMLPFADILDAFVVHVEKTPSASLVSCEGTSYTYKEGMELVSQVSAHLHALGAGKDSCVAVLVERGPWYLLGALGVLACGAAYVPIDDAYPDERVSFMLKDACVFAVLAAGKTFDRARKVCDAAGIDASIVDLGALEASDCDAAPASVSPQDTACVIYTSGSTGTPKGVLITRGGVANVCQWHAEYMAVRPESVYGMYPSYSFVSHIEPMLAPLAVGATVEVIPAQTRYDMPKLASLVAARGITHLKMGASVGREFLRELDAQTPLQKLMLSGEKLGEIQAPSYIDVVDAYGPTEYTAQAAAAHVKEKPCAESVGLPVFNTNLYVVDSSLRCVPTGAVGQLCFSGAQMAKGYLNRPNETERAFVANPFANGRPEHERLYLSGDLARMLPDGSVGIIGRMDSQVKIRGNRVELGEVEECIRQLDGVESVVVRPFDGGDGAALVAYVVLESDHAPQLDDSEALAEAVRSGVQKAKPNYMVPSFVMRLEKMPLNANSKLDKRALPVPCAQRQAEDRIAARTSLEEKVVRVFEDVLEVEGLGIDDDFLHLGGDSLRAIRVAAALQSYEIRAMDIPVLRTPRRVAEHIEGCSDADAGVGAASRAVNSFKDDPNLSDLFLVFNKVENPVKRLVFVHTSLGSSVAYKPMSKFIDPRVEFGALEHYNMLHPGHYIESFDEVVEENLAVLKLHQPTGPYNLGGWSYGGTVAYEMAYRLEQRGDVVENLFLLDSYFSDVRPVLGYYEKLDRMLPKFMSEKIMQSVLEIGKGMPHIDRKTSREFLDSLIVADRHVDSCVLRDLKAHTVFFSAISNRKPQGRFLRVEDDPESRINIPIRIMRILDGKFTRSLDPSVKISASQEYIEVNTNHLSMANLGPSKGIAQYINEVLLG